MPQKVVIIGSGIGGSGIGALLAHSTKAEITLFEKNTILGGRCASYKRTTDEGNWIFDVGCHIFSTCDKGPLGEIMWRCGRKIKWSYTRNPGPRINVMGMELSGLARTKKKPSDPKKKKKKNMTSYLRRIQIEETWQYDEVPLIEFLNEFFGPKKAAVLKLMYSMNAGVMFGTDPHSTSTGEFLRCMGDNYQKMSSGYPIGGGTGIIPETYCKIIRDRGGKILLGSEGRITKVIVEDNKVKGVEAGPNNDFFEADIVIANSDIKTTLTLVGEKYFPKEYVKYVRALKWGGQVCSVKIGIDKIITDQKMLTFIPKMDQNSDLQKMIADPENIGKVDFGSQGVPEKTALLIVPTSNHDPAVAPEGCQNIHTVTPTAFGSMIKWNKSDEKKWEQACLNTLFSLWPELEDYIVIEEFISTSHLEARFGKEGAGTGIAQSIDQVGKKRPSMVSPIEGFYYCSGDAGGWGIGTELPARAALELLDILQRQKVLTFSN